MSATKGLRLALMVLCAVTFIFGSDASAGRPRKNFRKRSGKIHWTYELKSGLAKAKDQHKPVMVDFMAVWCPPCKAMEDSTFSDPAVIRKAEAFIPVRIDIDKQRELAARYNALARKYGGIGIPNILFMTGDGTKLKHIVGYYDPRQLIAAMDSALTMSK